VALGKAIERATSFGRAVVLVPAGKGLGGSFVELELDVGQQLGAMGVHPLFERAIDALGLADEVPAERFAPRDVPLVVDTRSSKLIYDGVWLSRAPESAYRLVKALAARGGPMPTLETDLAISGARRTDGTTMGVAHRLRGWIAESYAELGLRPPPELERDGLVRSVGKRGWELTQRALVR
jgi:hypothetical protein